MRKYYIILAAIIGITIGCGKEFLDIKRDANQVVPSNIKDYMTILNRDIMLYTSSDLHFLSTDEYFIKNEADLIAASRFSPYHRNVYTWADRVYHDDERDIRDWHEAYERIMYANLALDVEKISPSDSEVNQWNQIRIAARFHRAWNFYHLAQSFCEVYDPVTAANKLGLPLRLDYDVSIEYTRGSLKEVYDQILKDLIDAENIPVTSQENIYLPGISAVQALLARVYLQMGAYPEALAYSEKVLQRKDSLLNYNSLTGNVSSIYSSLFEPYGKNNPSIILYTSRQVGGIMIPNRIIADTILYKSLRDDDLRKRVYYFSRPDGTRVYVGSYCGMGGLEYFTGLSVEEVLLTRAECFTRLNRYDEAVADLNKLKRNRYINFISENPQSANLLEIILAEREKELYMRGRRWEDVRRLNHEGVYVTSFRRKVGDESFILEKGSAKWKWPIPENEITNNQLQQNDR
ncbi:RagB/SusD family nutrient uptake outer membrane protein [Sphingobacterium sp. SGL-16]|uniref:RagB/SusD family nutrient uptake outer membrane protein n=1 Tax=Sphingobacterium sp. SGL-16 TaxID=2710883 RepID=UPI0013ECA699|nr:RagB/SusD family nutrient uptake outer membrane protein [Sphingobacterium sp. SGL-16]NGM72828.1 RagB/SusD family nutrient uptake outer membrane protein [Sphingobacterium sp. SGL-16]